MELEAKSRGEQAPVKTSLASAQKSVRSTNTATSTATSSDTTGITRKTFTR